MSRSQLDRHDHAREPRGDDSGCTILHVDMDAFFASVEVRERPELRDQPVIIGGQGGRGVVLSATYPARKLGVHSAMPMSRAIRMAPQAVVISPRHDVYSEVSRNVMKIFESITPLVQPLSVDEAFLDVSGAVKLMGNPAHIGDVLRERVWNEQGITCSVGVASTMFVAKLATNYAKPDGLHVVPKDKVIEFLHPLPITALWGVGDKTAEQLHRMGMMTVGDIANTPLRTLIKIVGQASGEHLSELSWGRDPRSVTPESAEKSMGADRTFNHDLDDPEEILAQLLDLCEHLAARLRKAHVHGRTVTLRVRFGDFTSISRSKTLGEPTDVAKEIYATAKALFENLNLQRARVRLVGVKVDGLTDATEGAVQLTFSERESGWREAERVVDQAHRKFGRGLIKPARLVKPQDND